MAVVGSLLVNIKANASGVSKGVRSAISELNGFNRQLRKGQTWVDAFGGSTKKAAVTTASFGKSLAALGAGYVAYRAIRGVISSVEGLNQEMHKSLAIMDKVTAAQRRMMVRTAQTSARGTQFSAKETASGYYYLASAGMDAKQSMAALPQVALFAQAAMADMATATDLVTDAQSALGMTVKDSQQNLKNLTRVTDVLVAANKMANATAHQFSEALSSGAGAAAKMVGMEIEEVTAILAAFADQGVKGSEAGTQVAIVLRDLETKAIKNAGAFRSAGIAVHDASGEFRNVADVLGDIERKMAGMSDFARKKMLLDLGFSDKSVKSLQMLLGMSAKIREYQDELKGAAGTTKEVAEAMQTPWQKGWKAMKDAVLEVMTAFQPLIDSLGYLMQTVGAAVKGWVEMFRRAYDWAVKLWNKIREFTGRGDVAKSLSAKERQMLKAAGITVGDDKATATTSTVQQAKENLAPYTVRAGFMNSADYQAGRERTRQAAVRFDADMRLRRREPAMEFLKELQAGAARASQAMLSPMEEFQQHVMTLQSLLRSGTITVGEYAAGITSVKTAMKLAKDQANQHRGEQLKQQVERPAEAFKRQMDEIKELFAAGAIDLETAKRAMGPLVRDSQKTAEEVAKQQRTDQLREFQNAVRELQELNRKMNAGTV